MTNPMMARDENRISEIVRKSTRARSAPFVQPLRAGRAWLLGYTYAETPKTMLDEE
jgi:hypothetical protein